MFELFATWADVFRYAARIIAWISAGGITAVVCLGLAWFLPRLRVHFLVGAALACFATIIYGYGVSHERDLAQTNLARMQKQFDTLQTKVEVEAKKHRDVLETAIAQHNTETSQLEKDYEARLAKAAAGVCAITPDDVRVLDRLRR